MNNHGQTFFLTATEPSGDRLGASLIQALKAECPDARFVGVAGPLMRAAGCEALMQQESLAVMGIWEVLKQLPRLLKARKTVAELALELHQKNARLIYIGIDAPDFNLAIETTLKTQGIKTVHVNSPTVWAWRAGRIKKIKRAVDLMLVLFPFETKIYEAHEIPVKYIGHPLADDLPLESQKHPARIALGISDQEKILCLMPGSRSAEIKYLAPIFLKAAETCQTKIPHLKILVPMINEKRAEQFETTIQGSSLHPEVSTGNAHQILQAADVVLIASGTATLEAMLCKTPMVIAYKMDALTTWLVRRLIKIAHVGLPNILAGKKIVPEFIQEKATADNLANACLKLFAEESQEGLQQMFHEQHQVLKKDAAKEAAKAILALI